MPTQLHAQEQVAREFQLEDTRTWTLDLYLLWQIFVTAVRVQLLEGRVSGGVYVCDILRTCCTSAARHGCRRIPYSDPRVGRLGGPGVVASPVVIIFTVRLALPIRLTLLICLRIRSRVE